MNTSIFDLFIQIFFRIIKTAFLVKIDTVRHLLRLFEGFVDPGVEVVHSGIRISFQTLLFLKENPTGCTDAISKQSHPHATAYVVCQAHAKPRGADTTSICEDILANQEAEECGSCQKWPDSNNTETNETISNYFRVISEHCKGI